ncbi:hypothetical protein [Desulfuromonas acetoxidans]|uniref:hypothetical protein n=1 Tax=Desulfuromonas acetoxidans TaxID=891 RepID=UPI00292D6C7E|nr:hypothetical protein [Desulfuromonas acetoxidans]
MDDYFEFKLTGLTEGLDAFCVGLEKQIPFITALALTWTAQQAKGDLISEMESVFDRPTSYTLNALFVRAARKTRLEAKIETKLWGNKYLSVQVFGGKRGQKRSELHMQRAGIMHGFPHWVPGSGARLNKFGNMSGGQVMQVLSRLQAAFDPYQNTTEKSLKRNRKPREYFATTKHSSHLAPGVWERYGRGKRKVRPVMIFVKEATYSKRLKFHEVAGESAERNIEDQFFKALDYVDTRL